MARPSILFFLLAGFGCGGSSALTANDDAGADTGTSPLLWSQRPAVAGNDWAAVWGSGDTVFCAGSGGMLARSSDAGLTWTLVAAAGAGAGGMRFHDISGTTSADAWLVGSLDPTHAVLLRSSDEGWTWNPREAGTGVVVRAVWAAGNQRVLVASADGRILRSTDGGATWEPRHAEPGVELFDLWANSKGDAYAVGARGPGGGGVVLASRDTGDTWTAVAINPPGSLWHVWGTPNGNAVYAAGAGATVAWTLDRGATWSVRGQALSNADLDLTNVWVTPDDGTPYFTSARGLVGGIEYLPGGAIRFSFEDLPRQGTAAAIPAAIWGATGGDVWAVGAGGSIWHRP